jgi:RimJ/RimL family protein N-acetyltransferase
MPGLNLVKFSALGVMKGSEVVTGVIYHNYFEEYKNIEMSIVATNPRWATKSVLKQLLSYPFKQLGCQRVTACIAASNERAAKLVLGLGFKHEGTVRMGCGNEDMYIFGMLEKEAKRWLGE